MSLVPLHSDLWLGKKTSVAALCEAPAESASGCQRRRERSDSLCKGGGGFMLDPCFLGGSFGRCQTLCWPELCFTVSLPSHALLVHDLPHAVWFCRWFASWQIEVYDYEVWIFLGAGFVTLWCEPLHIRMSSFSRHKLVMKRFCIPCCTKQAFLWVQRFITGRFLPELLPSYDTPNSRNVQND